MPEATPELLEQYDAFLFGIPTRYGNFPAQFKAFWDRTGGQWMSGAFWGKYAGLFVSTASSGGGQESTCIAAMSTLAHHGIVYVPLGYKKAFGILTDLKEVRGGSPWGAGTFAVSFPISGLTVVETCARLARASGHCSATDHATCDSTLTRLLNPMQGADGSRQPTETELELATIQGKAFYEIVSEVNHTSGQ